MQINVTLPPGSSLAASNRAAELVDAQLEAMKRTSASPDGAIRHYVRRTGRAELDEHAEPVGRSEYILILNPDAEVGRQELLDGLLADLRANVPGVEFEADQPLAHLISHMLSGVQAQIAIKVYGDDLNRLQQLADQIKTEIEDVPGLTPPVVDPQESSTSCTSSSGRPTWRTTG